MNTDKLLTPELLQQYLEMAWPVLGSLALSIVVLVVGWFVSKWAERAATRALRGAKVDEELARFLGQLASWGVIILALIGALTRLGIATSSLLAVLGSAGLAIGLALKGTLGNFASGVVLLVFRPFHIGDSVELQGTSGTVADIGLWATTVHTFDGEVAVLPNGDVTNARILNKTRRGQRRVKVSVGVDYGTPIDEVRALLTEAAHAPDQGLSEPAPDARFSSFGASSINFDVLMWVEAADVTAGTQALAASVQRALGEAGVGIPYDQVVLHADEGLLESLPLAAR